jgi:hypothetical protein
VQSILTRLTKGNFRQVCLRLSAHLFVANRTVFAIDIPPARRSALLVLRERFSSGFSVGRLETLISCCSWSGGCLCKDSRQFIRKKCPGPSLVKCVQSSRLNRCSLLIMKPTCFFNIQDLQHHKDEVFAMVPFPKIRTVTFWYLLNRNRIHVSSASKDLECLAKGTRVSDAFNHVEAEEPMSNGDTMHKRRDTNRWLRTLAIRS